MKPVDAIKDPTKSIEQIRRYAERIKADEPEVFFVGDKVRIKLKSTTFTKGYAPRWTKELFTIDSVMSPKDRFKSHR